MRYREIAKRLRKLGCQPARQGKGSHIMWFNPATKGYTAIPDWGAKDLNPGTIRGIVKDLGLDKDDFGPVK